MKRQCEKNSILHFKDPSVRFDKEEPMCRTCDDYQTCKRIWENMDEPLECPLCGVSPFSGHCWGCGYSVKTDVQKKNSQVEK